MRPIHNNKINTHCFSLYSKLDVKDIKEIRQLKRLDRCLMIFEAPRVTKISTQAAKILINGPFDIIELKSLKKVSNKTLSVLANFKGALTIGLETLTDAQAVILLQNKAALEINLKKITISCAKILGSSYEGNILELKLLKSIHPKAFEYLNKFKGDYLNISEFRQKAIHKLN